MRNDRHDLKGQPLKQSFWGEKGQKERESPTGNQERWRKEEKKKKEKDGRPVGSVG